MHWVLSAALYFDQFSARVLSAACSSARQDSLVRPTAMAYPAAALQLGETSSLGGLSASAIAGSPSIRTTTAILLAEADIIRGLTFAVSSLRWLYARPQRRTGAWCSVPSRLASRNARVWPPRAGRLSKTRPSATWRNCSAPTPTARRLSGG